MLGFAWTPGAGDYKHYPPYVNLTGNRLTVRGTEKLNGPHPMMGDTVSIELPDDQLAILAAALKPSLDHISKLEGERDRLRAEVRMAAERLSIEGQIAAPTISEEGRLRSKMLLISRELFAALNGSPPSDNKGKNDG